MFNYKDATTMICNERPIRQESLFAVQLVYVVHWIYLCTFEFVYAGLLISKILNNYLLQKEANQAAYLKWNPSHHVHPIMNNAF